jgi:hypothetical protein
MQVGTPSNNRAADGTMMQPYTETIDGVRNQFFRAGTGSKIEEIKSDRPSVNSQNFKKQVMREALQGIGWNYDFTLDATAHSVALRAGSALRRSTSRSVSFRTI